MGRTVTAGHRTTDGNGLPVPRDAAEARARVAKALTVGASGQGGVPSPVALGDALLVTSELVTNALRHGGGLTGFDVELDPTEVKISVADASDELPHRSGPSGPERVVGLPEGGFGWPMIRLLALEVRLSLPSAGGKTIEVRLPLR